MSTDEIKQIASAYLEYFPEEATEVKRLFARLDGAEQFNNRKSFTGHGTGAALVLSPDRTKLLLIHHLALDKWMQPGGHWDPEDAAPWDVARREAEEETGVQIAQRLHLDSSHSDTPIDIDVHDIPERPARNEPAHAHYDFRYVFVAASEQLTPQLDEVTSAVWVPLGDLSDQRLEHVQLCVAKMQALDFIA